MRRKSQTFSPEEIQRIIQLLSTTNMTIAEIAQRMDCSTNAISNVNRKNKVRDYGGKRETWTSTAAK